MNVQWKLYYIQKTSFHKPTSIAIGLNNKNRLNCLELELQVTSSLTHKNRPSSLTTESQITLLCLFQFLLCVEINSECDSLIFATHLQKSHQRHLWPRTRRKTKTKKHTCSPELSYNKEKKYICAFVRIYIFSLMVLQEKAATRK